DKQVVFLSRDRFGIKPLHFTQTPTAFLAGSEIKQFLALKDFCTEIYEPALHDFLQFGLLNHNQHTFFKNVFSLRGGHNLIYDLATNKFEIRQWYFLEKEAARKKLSPREAAISFRKEFEEAVRIHLRSDVKLGSCLSGGLDSSSIVSITRKILGKDMPIYTITSCNENAAY